MHSYVFGSDFSVRPSRAPLTFRVNGALGATVLKIRCWISLPFFSNLFIASVVESVRFWHSNIGTHVDRGRGASNVNLSTNTEFNGRKIKFSVWNGGASEGEKVREDQKSHLRRHVSLYTCTAPTWINFEPFPVSYSPHPQIFFPSLCIRR